MSKNAQYLTARHNLLHSIKFGITDGNQISRLACVGPSVSCAASVVSFAAFGVSDSHPTGCKASFVRRGAPARRSSQLFVRREAQWLFVSLWSQFCSNACGRSFVSMQRARALRSAMFLRVRAGRYSSRTFALEIMRMFELQLRRKGTTPRTHH